MPRTKLTEKIIPTLRGRPKESNSQEPVIWFDTTLPGFGVMVSTKTGLKTYVVQRDLPNGKTVRRTIGLYKTEIKSLDEAREKAAEIIHQLRHGIDPRTAARGQLTLAEASQAYLSARPNMAERSKRDYARIFDLYLSDWRDTKLSGISREMVEKRHLELGEQRGQATANGVMRVVRAVYNWAVERYPDVGANPVRLKRQWYKIHRRERHVSADQLPRFYAAVLNLENPVARDYLLLLLFTGLRREEAASLTWPDVDFAARVIRLPALRTKPGRSFDVPMSEFVLRMLRARRKLGDTEYVFPAHGRGYINDPKHPLGLIADACGIRVSAHDLRRTWAKAALAAGIHTVHLKALLNHSVGESDVTIGYISLSTEDLRAPAQRVADQLAAWCKIKRRNA